MVHEIMVSIFVRFATAWTKLILESRIYQEGVLGQSAEFVCGEFQFTFQALKRVVDTIIKIEDYAGGYRKSLQTTTRGYNMIQAIDFGRNQMRNGQTSEDFLAVLMRLLHYVDATDPRDYIYGFLAFYKASDP